MAIYSGGFNTTVATSAAPSFDIKSASTNSPKLMEYGINLGAATASTYGLGRPGNDGSVAQTSAVLLQAENPSDPTAQTGTAVAWGTAPTVPAIFLRRCYLPATIGAGIIWTFPRGLTLPVSKGVVNWNIAASAANTAIWAICDE
jgi:hypothetical protein